MKATEEVLTKKPRNKTKKIKPVLELVGEEEEYQYDKNAPVKERGASTEAELNDVFGSLSPSPKGEGEGEGDIEAPLQYNNNVEEELIQNPIIGEEEIVGVEEPNVSLEKEKEEGEI